MGNLCLMHQSFALFLGIRAEFSILDLDVLFSFQNLHNLGYKFNNLKFCDFDHWSKINKSEKYFLM